MKADAAMSAAPDGGGPAFADSGFASSSQDASSLASRLAGLPDLDSAALRDEWRRLHRAEPPRISRDLLVRAIAYGLQEREFGGLPKWARQSLTGSAGASVAEEGLEPRSRGSEPPAPALKPGARLLREWHGRTRTVVVLDDAFEFEGRRYRSLTQIAREITGAHWSGPRFFGLTERHAAAQAGARPRGTGHLEDVSCPDPSDWPEPCEPSEGCEPSEPCASTVRRDLLGVDAQGARHHRNPRERSRGSTPGENARG